MKFYGENNFDALRQKFDGQLQDVVLTAKLEDLFTPQPFSMRWRVANLAAQVLGFVCNVVSALTAFSLFSYALFLSFVPALGSWAAWGMAMSVSIILCLVIEIFKRYSTNHFLQAVIQYKKFDSFLFGLALVCCGISVGTSFVGARWIPSAISQAPIYHSPTLENLDSIHTFFLNQIANLQTEIEQTRKESTKPTGMLSSTARPLVAALQKQKNTLQNSHQIAVSEARIRNEQATTLAQRQHEEALAAYAQQTAHYTSLLGWVTLALEGVYLACMLFSWLYFWNSYKERCALAAQEKNGSNNNENRYTKIVAEQPPHHSNDTTTATEKRPIGFFTNPPTTEKDTIIVVKTTNENRQLPKCQHCNTTFLPNHHKQKYCKTPCRIAAWELRTGKTFRTKTTFVV